MINPDISYLIGLKYLNLKCKELEMVILKKTLKFSNLLNIPPSCDH